MYYIKKGLNWYIYVVLYKWKYVLLAVGIMFLFLQLDNMSYLNTDGSASVNTNPSQKHRQHVAAKKVLSKWEQPQHSKLMKDPQGRSISLRGTRDADLIKYFPNSNGKFTCFSSKEEIEYIRVNDDYCDCPTDGSDEPGTNACNNGIFYCEKRSHNSAVIVPSYRVNDGVCDCCDGSDEWMEISVLDANDVSEDRPLKYRLTHCENTCRNLIQ